MILRSRLFQVIFCILVVVALWAIGQTTRMPEQEERLGWQALLLCNETSSLAGTERLSFWEDGRAELRKLRESGAYADDKPLEGTWDFDEASGRYQIELGGRSASYLLVQPPDSRTCMLIAGELGSADLTASWFAVFVDDTVDWWDRERDYR